MEKISHIVRGNTRVSSVDLKGASAVRPGALSFGRDVGTSTGPSENVGTTASRAASLHTQQVEQRRASSDKEQIVQQMSDQFFMSRMRRPDEVKPQLDKLAAIEKVGQAKEEAAAESEELDLSGATNEEKAQPAGYQPRGSYIDVHA